MTPVPNRDGRERLLVVGNGMAGARVVEEILDRGGGERFEITIFGAEAHGSYNRLLLSGVLAGREDPRDIVLNPLEWYEENGITLHAALPVIGIDRRARSLSTADGATRPYDKLIIATGSRPFLPPVQGLHARDGSLKPGVFAFRTIDDCRAMLEWARNCGRAVVVGGGLLGLEAAHGLRERGLEVDLVHRASRLMNLQLDADAAAMLAQHVQQQGLRVHLQASTTRLLGDDTPTGLELDNGTQLACDMVVFATGIRPNVELAARAGLVVERGIVVDDAMRALDCDDVFALGECAQHRGEVYGVVGPIFDQAAVLADRVTGADPAAEYTGSGIVTKLKVSGIQLATIGSAEPERDDDEVVRFIDTGRGIYQTIVIRDGKLAGAILLGDLAKVSSLIRAFDHSTALPHERAALLFDLGRPSAGHDPADLPDDAHICNCNAVSKGDIRASVLAGSRTIRDVAGDTRATTGCGSCREQVQQIIEWVGAPSTPRAA